MVSPFALCIWVNSEFLEQMLCLGIFPGLTLAIFEKPTDTASARNASLTRTFQCTSKTVDMRPGADSRRNAPQLDLCLLSQKLEPAACAKTPILTLICPACYEGIMGLPSLGR